MKFGVMELPRSMAETADLARHTDEAGYDWLGVADTPTVYQESYLHQFHALNHSERITVGPLVSHVVARHPVIVANLLATLQEAGGGRTRGTVATGNSAARGLGMRPATVGDLREGVAAIRGYWAGTGGPFRDSRIPATGLVRPAPPLFVSADGPRITALGGEVGDGVLYGGTMRPDVLARRVAAGRTRPGQEFWAGPAVSTCATVEEVLEDMGPIMVAIANRAFRGDLAERGVPAELHDDVRAMWRNYDYAYHGDATRPRNTAGDILSRPLAEYLLANFVVWGDESRWADSLSALESHGCDGVMFILGQRDQYAATRKITERLRSLGRLPGGTT